MAERTHQRAIAERQLASYGRQIGLVLLLVLVLLLLGTLGLSLSERVGYWYAFRWALDSAATVGGFHQPHTAVGQVIQVLLVVLGLSTLFYGLALVADLFVAGHLGDLLRLRRTQRMIDSLTEHTIVCGFGRVGRQVAYDLQAAGALVVVIDMGGENRPLAESEGLHFIEGDATEDAVLLEAGIAQAQSIVACADSDANNVFITLSARELRGDITIVARAAVEDTEKKLLRAGADRVVSPYKASGAEMARLALDRA
ncbi:MAG TPA: NAD(P)-binding protein [Solirubrobacteraceae bacterium]|jgi:voltage-gated potassium channel